MYRLILIYSCVSVVLCQTLSLRRIINEDEEIFWGHSSHLFSAHYEYVRTKEGVACILHQPPDEEERCIICDTSKTPECARFKPGDLIDVLRGDCVDSYLMVNPNTRDTECGTYLDVFEFISSLEI